MTKMKCEHCGWTGPQMDIIDGMCPDCEHDDELFEVQGCVFLNTRRDGYAPEQCYATMTVGELTAQLGNFSDDLPVYFRNDDGYTYGSLDYYDCVKSEEDY